MAQERYERRNRDLSHNIEVNMRPQIRLGGNERRLTGEEGRGVADQRQIMQQQNALRLRPVNIKYHLFFLI